MRRVLVSGGDRGIGRAIVERFCEAGDAVAFLYRADEAAAESVRAATGAPGFAADLGDPTQAAAAFNAASEALGGVDVLVNCAGIASFSLFTDIDDATWKRMLDVNLSAAFYLSRAAAPGMIHNKWGRMIQIGSMWGKVGASCEVHYSAAKAGLRGLTMGLAKELGPSGITVNCVEPGVIVTQMNAALSAETKEQLREETPLCRLGSPRDVAGLVYFLSTEEASFITGQCIGVDGGYVIGS